ncbi:MAG: hypothetical protein JXB30_18785 [Anaerolineae bacterium]|nr:hypothetical protein [Anaerolineae bacterium]
MSVEQPLEEQTTLEPRGHSKLGIASLAVSLITGLAYCLVMVVTFYLIFDMVSTSTMQDPNELILELQSGGQGGMMALVMLFGICMFSAPVLSMVGLGLGIGGLFQKDKNRLFPILGVIFGVLLLCGSGSFVLLSLVGALTGPPMQ